MMTTRRRVHARPSAVTLFALSAMAIGTRAAHAQLLDRYLPPPIIDNGSDFLRYGAGETTYAWTDEASAAAPGVTVLTRDHPEVDPLGIQVGPTRIDANVAEAIGDDSNPEALGSSKGSFVNETQANLSTVTDWTSTGIEAIAGVDDWEYATLPADSHTDWHAQISGHTDVGIHRFELAYSHLNLNVLPTSIDTLAGATGLLEAAAYQVDDLRASDLIRTGRFIVTPSLDLSSYRFANADGEDGTPVDLGINSRNVVTGTLTVRYELGTRRYAVATVQASGAEFTESGANLPARGYRDVEGLAGFDYEIDGALRVRALAGADKRFNDYSELGNPTKPIFDVEAIWTPTQLSTVTASVSHRIEDGIADGFTPFVFTTGRLELDHELERNLVLTAYGEVQNADYEFPSEHKIIYGGGLGATLKLNRHMAVVLTDDVTRQSSDEDDSYTRNIVLGQLRLSL